MRYLLDTHTLYWRALGSAQLSEVVDEILDDPTNEVFASAVNAFELSLKHRQGKLPDGDVLVPMLPRLLGQMRLASLPITVAHGLLAGSFTQTHRDPFDRLLAAQALTEDAVLLTRDPAFEQFGVVTLW